jgi:hypothetical protein
MILGKKKKKKERKVGRRHGEHFTHSSVAVSSGPLVRYDILNDTEIQSQICKSK